MTVVSFKRRSRLKRFKMVVEQLKQDTILLLRRMAGYNEAE